MTPLVVRPLENGEYEVISGHRRLFACKKLGIHEVPAIVYNIDRDQAAIALVDSNLHREHILPSEKAFAYKMKLDAMKHQGQTCGQVGHKSRDLLSDTDSGRQVQRYIRLTNLIPELLEKVDTGQIALSPGVELSYLDADTQHFVLEAMEQEGLHTILLPNCTYEESIPGRQADSGHDLHDHGRGKSQPKGNGSYS